MGRWIATGASLAALLLAGCSSVPPPRPAPESASAAPQSQAATTGMEARPSPQSPTQGPGSPPDQAPDLVAIPATADTPVLNPRPPPVGPRPDGVSRALVLRLGSQRFDYLEDDLVIHSGPLSSGRPGNATPKGRYAVLSKQRDKVSSRYTNQLGMQAWMPWSIQFHSHYFVHEGWLPGYADSHGCVRVGEADARFLFETLRQGDPVVVAD